MLSDRFKYDKIENINLNEIQKQTKELLLRKLNSYYQYENVSCDCGSCEFEVLADKDRYGLPVRTVICKRCGLVLINPRMTQESYNEFYNNEYRPLYVGNEKPTSAFFFQQYNHGIEIAEFLTANNISQYKYVLEIGCGAGGILAAFKERTIEVLGIDLGSEYVNYGINKDLNLLTCNSSQLLNDYKGKFDVIILSHVFEHFLDIGKELEIIKDLLSCNGLIYIELPGIKNLQYSYECDFLNLIQNAHTYNFDLDTLKQVLRINGFEFVCGNEYIRSVFKKSNCSDNSIYSYFEDIKSYLIDLEQNRHLYKEKYGCLVRGVSKEVRDERFGKIKEAVSKYEDKTVALYGTGNHTKLLLDYLSDNNKIIGLLDPDESKIGNSYYGYPVLDIKNITKVVSAIIISSDIYQQEIYERIKFLQSFQIDIIKIY